MFYNVLPRYSQGWRGFWFYGVTVAQEILVLLEIVRFSLELLQFFFIDVLLLVKVVVLYLLYTFLSVSFT